MFKHILPPDTVPDGNSLAIYSGANLVGIIFVVGDKLGFRYAPEWQKEGIPLSPRLNFDAPAKSEDIHAFFDAFMPEGQRREFLVEQEKLPANDLVGYLRRHGQDLPGSLHAEPVGKSEDRDVTSEILGSIGNDMPLTGLLPHSLLPGVNDKTPVVAKKTGSGWRFRLSNIEHPSTHIIKKGNDLCINEAFCMRLAQLCGFSAMDSDILSVNGNLAFITERFDREILPDGRIRRIEQKDFCQLAGLPSDQKYCRAGFGLTNEKIAALLPKSEIPAFLAGSIFSLVIGNSDDHGKNYALLYRDERRPELAPLYDLASISGLLFFDKKAHASTRLSRPIGNAVYDIYIKPDDLRRHAEIFGVEAKDLACILDETVRLVDANADKAAKDIQERLETLHVPTVEVAYLRAHMHGRIEEFYGKLAKDFLEFSSPEMETPQISFGLR